MRGIDILAQDNKNGLKLVDEVNYECIRDIIHHLQEACICLYKIELVKKELIELVLEGQEKDISLQEQLPEGYCEKIISKADKYSKKEIFTIIAPQCMSISMILFIISLIQLPSLDTFGICYSDILLLVFWGIFIVVGDKIIYRSLTSIEERSIFMQSQLPMLLGALVYFTLPMIFPITTTIVLNMKTDMWWMIVLYFLAGLYFYCSPFWKKEAKKYNSENY